MPESGKHGNTTGKPVIGMDPKLAALIRYHIVPYVSPVDGRKVKDEHRSSVVRAALLYKS